ncbi:hypothetical protein N9N97_00610 [Rickettsiaceae bacterium]|nr:hypothetical protein [Rickettsiaceae bacterium]
MIRSVWAAMSFVWHKIILGLDVITDGFVENSISLKKKEYRFCPKTFNKVLLEDYELGQILEKCNIVPLTKIEEEVYNQKFEKYSRKVFNAFKLDKHFVKSIWFIFVTNIILDLYDCGICLYVFNTVFALLFYFIIFLYPFILILKKARMRWGEVIKKIWLDFFFNPLRSILFTTVLASLAYSRLLEDFVRYIYELVNSFKVGGYDKLLTYIVIVLMVFFMYFVLMHIFQLCLKAIDNKWSFLKRGDVLFLSLYFIVPLVCLPVYYNIQYMQHGSKELWLKSRNIIISSIFMMYAYHISFYSKVVKNYRYKHRSLLKKAVFYDG